MGIRRAIQAPFEKGVNFTIWLEYSNAETVNENFFTKADFENVKKLGCDIVRLPIQFERFCSEEDGYKVPQVLLNILDRVAAWSKELELYVIFDFHNKTNVDSHTENDVDKILTPIWTQVAERYKDASDYIVYELMNEPHGIEIPVWNDIIAKLFKHVRSIDKNHYIIVGGADWNSFTGMKALPDFEDDKVIYTFHFYDPHTFTHQGASWCHMERVIGIPFPYDETKMPTMPENPTAEEEYKFKTYPEQGTLDKVVGCFDRYVDFSIERNAPVFCGEFGCFAPFIEHEMRANWYRIVAGLLKERDIARTSWDYYGSFGIFNMRKREPGQPFTMPKFPEDLNKDVVKALGMTIEN